MRIVLIANPTSGRKNAPQAAEQTLAAFKDAGLDASLQLTDASGAAKRLAAEAVDAGANVVVGCGGDGTIQEIASSIQGTNTALALLPGGRCNDLAYALGQGGNVKNEIKRKQRIDALTQALKTGSLDCKKVDVGLFQPKEGEERIFCTVATLGFDTEVSRFVEQRKLPIKGTMSYVYGVFRCLGKFNFPRVKLRGDFGEFEGEILLTATGNTACYGGAMHIVPDAKPDDGLFHFCVVKKIPRRTVLSFLPRVMKGSHINHPAVTLLESKEIEIETPDGPEWICADGETLGQTPAKIINLPGALKVLDLSIDL